MKKTIKVPVAERALLKRINRRLQKQDTMVAKLRGRAAVELGEYVVVPIPNFADVIGWGKAGPLSRVERDNVDLEELGRELGVLRPWEAVASEGGA